MQLGDMDNSNQREKLEANLKTEIKKLQRFRDQIKTWAASNEIKDKSALTQARADIERRMERFKALEKEAKTKAFSKEGLQAAAARQDPKEKARHEMREWLNGTVDSLNEQIDGFEAELEDLGPSGGGKKAKKPPPRVAHLEESIARHRQHITRLEQMLRLLDNEEITPEDVEGVKDLVDDYLERNQDDPDEFATPDDLYYDIVEALDALSEAVVAAPPSHSKATRDKELQREREKEEKERERQKAAAAAAKAQLAALGNTRLAAETDDEKKLAAGVVAPAGASVAPGSNTATPAAPGSLAPVAQATKPVVAFPTTAQPTAPPPPPPPPARNPAKDPSSPAAGGPLNGSSSSPGTPIRNQTAAVASAPPGPSPLTPSANPAGDAAYVVEEHPSQDGVAALSGATAVDAGSAWSSFNEPSQEAVAQEEPAAKASVPPANAVEDAYDAAIEAGIDQLPLQMAAMGIRDAGTPSLSSAQTLQLLQAAAPRSVPTYGDAVWQRLPLRPRPPVVPPPAYYPAQRLLVFDNPALFEKLETKSPETLFFAFYQQPGTYQQYLAARTLKMKGWLYHKQYNVWFQRQQEPRSLGDDWEKGDYRYFDYQVRVAPEVTADSSPAVSGWCYRQKSDFLFDYKLLEDELVA
jgi:CCR4-NOT transcription complex subunit 3